MGSSSSCILPLFSQLSPVDSTGFAGLADLKEFTWDGILQGTRTMRLRLSALWLFLIGFSLYTWPSHAQVTNKVRYTLLNPSYLIDDCLLCGRPTIQEPLRGTFDLVVVQDTPPYTRYALEDIEFTSSAGSSLQKQVIGGGIYERFEEFGLVQDMTLSTRITSAYTNEPAYFTNGTPAIEKPFPLIELSLTQTNGSFAHTFSMHLLAAPVQELWFSTSKSFTSTNLSSPTNIISAGDLISSTGHVIRRNQDLVQRLGIMPPVPDLGLDAVDLASGGEIFFSIPVDVFSETLGPIQNGDLLSSRGVIVKRNQELLAAFHPSSTNDAGLDAVQVMPTGEILFSIQSEVLVSNTVTLSRGDILSDQGQVYLTHQQLFANFSPAITNHDFGLAALRILPSGEIWFSVEEGFLDNKLGTIQPGDLLSTLGYKVFSNRDLVTAFAPNDPSQDYGLDALWVVTDTLPSKPPPQIVSQTLSGGMLHFEWSGVGSAFQMENAFAPLGPWLPASQIAPGLSCDLLVDTTGATSIFYRLRQW